MRIKKALATFVAGTFLFGSMATANAAQFSDIAGKDSAAAIQKLNALGVINGYEDGTFKPEGEITRAEFAKIAVIAAGLEDSADLLKDSASMYSDVKSGAWYTGWVNIASSQGYLKGYPNGSFQPNAQISYAEAITILMRILGYDDRLPGSWPVDYITKAAAEDVTDDVKVVASAKATRGDVAMLTSNTLDTSIVEWDEDADKFEYKLDKDDEEISLLADSFDGTLVEDVVVSSWELNDDTYKLKPVVGENVDFAEEFALGGVGAVPSLADRVVDYIYNEDDEVVYVDAKDYGVIVDDEVTVGDDQVEIADKTYDVATGATYVVSGTVAGVADAAALKTATEGATDVDIDAEFIKVVLDEDGDVARFVVKNLPETATVDENEDGSISFKANANPANFFEPTDLDDEDTEYLIVKDGNVAALADIKENDQVIVSKDSNGLDYYIEVFSKNVEGEVTTAKGDLSEITIDGTKYDLDANAYVSLNAGEDVDDLTSDNIDDLFDENVTAYFNKAGDVQYLVSDTDAESDDIYGVVTREAWDDVKDGDDTYFIKVLKKDGTEAVYEFDTDEVKSATIVGTYDQASFVDTFVKFNVNSDNQIDSFEVVADNNQDITDVDGSRLTIEGQDELVTSDVVIFNTNPSDADDEAEVISWSTFKNAIDNKNQDFLDATVVYDDDRVTYIVVDTAVNSGDDVAVFVDASKDGDGDYVIFNINGEEVKKYVADHVYKTTPKTLANEISIYDTNILDENFVVTYDTTGEDVDVIKVLVEDDATSVVKVSDIDGTDAIELEDTVADTKSWRAVDEDELVIIDNRGDEPVFYDSLEDVDGKYVVVSPALDGDITWIVVVDKQ